MDVVVDWTRSTPHLLFVIYVTMLHTLVGVPHLPCVPPCRHTTVRHNAGVQTNVAVRTVATQTAVATQSAEQLAANRAGEEDAGELDARGVLLNRLEVPELRALLRERGQCGSSTAVGGLSACMAALR